MTGVLQELGSTFFPIPKKHHRKGLDLGRFMAADVAGLLLEEGSRSGAIMVAPDLVAHVTPRMADLVGLFC